MAEGSRGGRKRGLNWWRAEAETKRHREIIMKKRKCLKKKCLICGEAFMPRRSDSVVCSNRCRNVRGKRRYRAKKEREKDEDT
tara:strand:+ start:431 stop:679 length:249 start_codon:yes stop_codon:yes gene_type:complete